MEESSLTINSLPLSIVSATETFWKMTSTLCHYWFKKNSGFCPKAQNFGTFRTIRFVSNFAIMWSKYVSNYVWRDCRLPVTAFATSAQTSLMLIFCTLILKVKIFPYIIWSVFGPHVGENWSVDAILEDVSVSKTIVWC